jgi:hypothetical protein
MTYSILAEGLVKRFGDTVALDGIDLAARTGPGYLDDLPWVAVGAYLQRPEHRDLHRDNCARPDGDAW